MPENAAPAKKMSNITRRKFIATTATAASATVISPKLVWGAQANSKIKLGMAGCGGRGTWIAELFKKHGGYEISAAADYFQDRVNAFGDKFQVPQNRRFTSLSGYKKLLDTKVDAIAIENPPYFHPDQTAAAIDAGVHVYLAKPLAVDVPGCKSIEKSGEKATKNNLCLLVDFQTRANDFFIEALKRVHDGAIGDFVFGESSYHAPRLQIQAPPGTTVEARLKNWTFDKALSGDIITEQNIHTLDVMSWIMNQTPISAVGTGGRKVRIDVGDCWDYFTLVFEYKNNTGIAFSSRQFNGHDSRGGIRNRMFGTKGVLETEYGGQVLIRGENFYRGGSTGPIYEEGAVNNIAAFYKNITEGHFENSTVSPSVRSNLVTILGRKAAYTGQKIYWTDIIKSNKQLKADLRGLKS